MKTRVRFARRLPRLASLDEPRASAARNVPSSGAILSLGYRSREFDAAFLLDPTSETRTRFSLGQTGTSMRWIKSFCKA